MKEEATDNNDEDHYGHKEQNQNFDFLPNHLKLSHVKKVRLIKNLIVHCPIRLISLVISHFTPSLIHCLHPSYTPLLIRRMKDEHGFYFCFHNLHIF